MRGYALEMLPLPWLRSFTFLIDLLYCKGQGLPIRQETRLGQSHLDSNVAQFRPIRLKGIPSTGFVVSPSA